MLKQTLPVDSFLPQIVSALQAHSALVILAEPGAGKTTRVPVALAGVGSGIKSGEDGGERAGQWIVLQPRRWAARLTAQRIAEENGFHLGREVGYQVRFENRSSSETRILMMTEGVLLRRLVEDPELRGIAGVILDEFHERSLDLDLSIALLKEVQASFRPDLKIVVMSATLDPAPILRYLPGSKLFEVPGRVFPVERKHTSNESVVDAVRSVLPESGDVLVFLPGSYEIQKAVRDLEAWIDSASGRDPNLRGFQVLPLYASLPEEKQKAVFRSGGRKIICATNIAETSITLPGIRAVVDSGLQKVMRMDPALGFDRLETLRISKASAEQRAGRAGRVSEGVVLRLWDRGEQEQLRHFETPEVQRVNLSRALLMLSEFGVQDFEAFDWFEKPKSSMLDFARNQLSMLGFLEGARMTESGRRALRLPLEPAIAAVVIEAEREGVPHFGARFGAFLDSISKEERIRDFDGFLQRLNRLNSTEERVAQMIAKGSTRSGDRMGIPEVHSGEIDRYERVLIRACKARVCVADRVVGRRRVRARDGHLPEAALLLSALDQGDLVTHSWLPLRKKTLLEFSEKKRRLFWDESALRVKALQGIFFEDLEMSPTTELAAIPDDALPLLKDYLNRNRGSFFGAFPETSRFLKRVEFLNRGGASEAIGEQGSDSVIEIPWDEVLDAILSGKTKLGDLADGEILSAIEGFLGRDAIRMLDAEVPSHLEVPSGNRIRIDYDQDPPRLSVRLQEVFGLTETPRVCRGRVPVLMELLSPGFKPMQMTRDLKSFWSTTYFEVKKELKARYPKHSWPENPLEAPAVAYRRRR